MGDQQLPAYMRYGRSTKSGPITGGYNILTAGPWDSAGSTPSWRIGTLAASPGDCKARVYVVEYGWHAEGTVVGNPTIQPYINDSLSMATGTPLTDAVIDLGVTPTGTATFDTTGTRYLAAANDGADQKAWIRHVVALAGGTFADVFTWVVYTDLTLYTENQDVISPYLRKNA